jgi:hypothetical protein
MKAKTRIHKFLNRESVNIKDLAIRFLIDSNLHQIAFTCDISDGYDDFDQVLMIRKSKGRYIIQEYTINNTHYHAVIKDSISVTHDYKEVITVINNAIDYYSTPTSITDQTGSYAGLQVVQFAEK